MRRRTNGLTDRLLFLLALQLSVTAPALALPEDRQQPINLKADSASFDQRSGVSIYQGNVEVSQGTMYLAADQATVYFSADGEFQRMEAAGRPSRFRYQPTRSKPVINGVGNAIEYSAVKGEVVVSGDARFTQGDDVFKGDRIRYDLNKDVVYADSDQGKRIEITLTPPKK